MEELDKNDPARLKAIVDQIRIINSDPQKWILHNKGTQLHGYFGLDLDLKYRNGLIGNYLLIVLSTFLFPALSLGYNFSKFSQILHALEWKKEDIDHILEGYPTSLLIKPGLLPIHKIVEWEDPYWCWVRPLYSNYSGWFPLPEIVRFHEKLNNDRDKVARINIPHQPVEACLEIYTAAIQMLDQAIAADKDLFLVVHEEDEDDEA
jgi:hypothetical protein